MTLPAPAMSIRALSPSQERRLVDYLEDRFLDIARAYKKRSHPDATTLPTLASYLSATHTLLSLILQIPPLDPSAPLRTALLLRLSNDALSSIPGYTPDAATLPALLAWLSTLDRGWCAVLRSQSWDPHTLTPVDLPADVVPGRGPTGTERARLRSLLVGGADRIEGWLEALDAPGEDFTQALARLGVQAGFEEMFGRTMAELGSLRGTAAMNHPQGMVGTC